MLFLLSYVYVYRQVFHVTLMSIVIRSLVVAGRSLSIEDRSAIVSITRSIGLDRQSIRRA